MGSAIPRATLCRPRWRVGETGRGRKRLSQLLLIPSMQQGQEGRVHQVVSYTMPALGTEKDLLKEATPEMLRDHLIKKVQGSI